MENKILWIYSALILILIVGYINLEFSSNQEIDKLHSITNKNSEIYRSMLEDNYKIMAQNKMLIYDLNLTIDRLQNNIRIIEKEKLNLEHELEINTIRYNNKYNITMQPRYGDVIGFLKEDDTDSKEWTKDYDCTQFSHEVVRNAVDSGIFACIVTIDLDVPSNKYEYSGHDIIAFDTVDHGLQYFEPQNDKNVYMSIDMNYATYLGYSSDYKMWVVKYDSCFGVIPKVNIIK